MLSPPPTIATISPLSIGPTPASSSCGRSTRSARRIEERVLKKFEQPDLWQSGVECQLLRRGVHPVGAAEISCGGHLLCTLLLGPELLASWQLLLKATKNDTST